MKPTCFFRLVAVWAVLLVSAHAQEFEGTLKWRYQIEITDSALKTQAEAGPDAAAMEEMKAAMADPQMRAMLEQNPQMKAMMEAQMNAASGGGNALSSMFPTGTTVRLKGRRSHVQIEGGAMPMEIIQRGPSDTVHINRKARTFSLVPPDTDAEGETPPEVIKTSETARVLGYLCSRYEVTTVVKGESTTASIWATDEIEGLDASSLEALAESQAEASYLSQINGVPLRMQVVTPEARVLMEATLVETGGVPDSVFEVPAGFTEAPFAFGGFPARAP